MDTGKAESAAGSAQKRAAKVVAAASVTIPDADVKYDLASYVALCLKNHVLTQKGFAGKL